MFDVFKPRRTDDSFGGKKNSYIDYIREGEEYKNLSTKEYLNMIRPYLRDLIKDHKTPMETDKVIINAIQFGEWKIQLVMLNKCTSSKHFEETRLII